MSVEQKVKAEILPKSSPTRKSRRSGRITRIKKAPSQVCEIHGFAAVAMDKGGRWFGFESIPEQFGGVWRIRNSVEWFSLDLYDLGVAVNWRESLVVGVTEEPKEGIK